MCRIPVCIRFLPDLVLSSLVWSYQIWALPDPNLCPPKSRPMWTTKKAHTKSENTEHSVHSQSSSITGLNFEQSQNGNCLQQSKKQVPHTSNCYSSATVTTACHIPSYVPSALHFTENPVPYLDPAEFMVRNPDSDAAENFGSGTSLVLGIAWGISWLPDLVCQQTSC